MTRLEKAVVLAMVIFCLGLYVWLPRYINPYTPVIAEAQESEDCTACGQPVNCTWDVVSGGWIYH